MAACCDENIFIAHSRSRKSRQLLQRQAPRTQVGTRQLKPSGQSISGGPTSLLTLLQALVMLRVKERSDVTNVAAILPYVGFRFQKS